MWVYVYSVHVCVDVCVGVSLSVYGCAHVCKFTDIDSLMMIIKR